MFNQLQLETTNYCNSHCQFCPHNKYKADELGTMSDTLYEKILMDASKYPLKMFYPILNGEPFCDPDFIQRVYTAREYLPKTLIRIFTNGSLMTGADMDALAKVGGVAVSISVNGPTAEIRKRLMGLDDFDLVVEKARYLERKGLLEATTTVWHPTLNINHINALSKIPHPDVYTMQNWCGEIYPYHNDLPTNCPRVSMLTVLWTGKVCLCCFDPFDKVNFGDLSTQTIQEIWDSELYQKYINTHNRNEGQTLPLCDSCTQRA